MKYTRQERLVIGKQICDGVFSVHDAAEEYGISYYTAREYQRTYKAFQKRDGQAAADGRIMQPDGYGTPAPGAGEAEETDDKRQAFGQTDRRRQISGEPDDDCQASGQTNDRQRISGEPNDNGQAVGQTDDRQQVSGQSGESRQVPTGNLYRVYLHHLSREELEEELVRMKAREEKIRQLLD